MKLDIIKRISCVFLTLAGLALTGYSNVTYAVVDCTTGTSSIWPTDPIPSATDSDTVSVEIGVKFRSDVDGFICGLRFYKSATNLGIHLGTLWSDTGVNLASVTFSNETASGWQRMDFAAPVAITADTVYTASYLAPVGSYSVDQNFFTAEVISGPLTALSDTDIASPGNGVYQYGPGGFPVNTFNSSNYWVDVVFTQDSGPCSSASNPVVCENSFPGNPPSEWDISGAGDTSIQGFTTDISVNVSEVEDINRTVRFKIDTDAPDYRLDIYRMGYYDGMGARKVATVEPTATLPQDQPLCLTDATGLIDCGNWVESASWIVPADATSGIYFAKAIIEGGVNTGQASHIVFVVRDESSHSDLLFQTSDPTWQAYNDYEGNSLYAGTGPGTGLSGVGRAYKVSYNRPVIIRTTNNEESVFNAEYPMVRWLEANGYDVSYFSGIDSDRHGDLIPNHNVFMSVGHDEYWSGAQRSNVEAARDSGVHLAFFSGNEVFWKTRWENSIDGSATDYRTLVCYKDTHEGAKIDPLPGIWTGTWRDPRFSPPADGGRPENELTGVIFSVNGGSPASTASIKVPEENGKMRFWRNTTVAELASGTEATLPHGSLGFEWDEEYDNGFRPDGLIQLSLTSVDNAPVLTDFGSTFGLDTATHALTLYRADSGAIVFGAGTIQWSWGLDENHDGSNMPTSPDMQQATVNLFADMEVQPLTLQPGLLAATASTDATAPVSTVVVPAEGANVQLANPVVVSGTATDSGGGRVGGVEVSIDGGVTWAPASGRSNWTFDWTTPNVPSTVTIMTRATDDSLNMESPGAGSTVFVTSGTDTTAPTVIAQSPVNTAAAVSLDATVTAAFNEAMLAATINSSTFELRDGATLVPATISYVGTTATLTPNTLLTANTTYTVTVKGGVGGAEDLSGNSLASDVTWEFTTGAGEIPNCIGGTSIWPANVTPTVTADPDSTPVELGVKFTADIDGFICGIRFFKAVTNTGTHVGNLWTSGGALLATATFTNETSSSWQTVNFANPVAITANTTYVASYHAPVGHYSLDEGYFNGNSQDNPPLHALEDVASGGNGVFLSGPSGFPNTSFLASNYWVDVIYTNEIVPADTTPPTVTLMTPADNSVGIDPATAVTAVFSEELISASVDASTFVLQGPSGQVAATVTYAGNTATLTPTTPLAPNTTYFATVKGGATGVKDLALNALLSDVTWQFSTNVDCINGTSTIWAPTTTPTITADVDTAAVELGVKFNADVDGFICGIRFYKGASNLGTHVGNLWDITGTQLATATFTNESVSGWQEVRFTNPVQITANTTYVASYHAPLGQYSVDADYFNGASEDNPPLHAPEDIASGGNGVYLYGPGGYPGNTFSSSNYWVDVVFAPNTLGGDTIPPTITTVTPADDSVDISTATTVTAVFSEALNPASVDPTTFELRDPGNALIAATISYAGNTATLTPLAPLAANTTYVATVFGGLTGVEDLAGNSLVLDRTWQFTTSDLPDETPPIVTLITPADTSTDISPATAVTAVFSEALDPASVVLATFELRNPANALIAATISYAGNTATLTPLAPLAENTTYIATVFGGAAGVKDLAGNPLALDKIWQFTTGGVVAGALIDASFDTDTDGFLYVDDAFRNTNEPTYANGTRLNTGGFSGGGLQILLGGIDDENIFDISGAWQQNFVLAAPNDVTVSFRYKLTQTPHFEGDELSQVLLSIDGTLQDVGGDDFIDQVVGDGENGPEKTTGWQLFVTNITLPAGNHNIAIGGFNNKKTFNNESTEILIDDVQVSITVPPPP